MGTETDQPFPQDRGFIGARLRDAPLVAAVRLEPFLRLGDAGTLGRAAGRMPRPVLIAAGLAATAGLAAVIHVTGGAVGVGLGGHLPRVFSEASQSQR
jgi:hypothetical protein